jgi:hypothetical protein
MRGLSVRRWRQGEAFAVRNAADERMAVKSHFVMIVKRSAMSKW